jgi:hypothetical protein
MRIRTGRFQFEEQARSEVASRKKQGVYKERPQGRLVDKRHPGQLRSE